VQDVRLAKQFEGLVKLDNRFELVQEAAMGIVCFRLKVTLTVHVSKAKTLNTVLSFKLSTNVINYSFKMH